MTMGAALRRRLPPPPTVIACMAMLRGLPVLLLFALLPFSAAAQAPSTTARYFPLTDVSGFLGLTDELQRRVDEDGHARVNHFCVVGEELRSPGEKRPWVSAITFWQEAGDIQGYNQGYPDDPVTNLNTPGALHVDLATGVVPTPDDINGSTYLVDRAWVDRLLRNCWRHGQAVVLIRHTGRRRASAHRDAGADPPTEQ